MVKIKICGIQHLKEIEYLNEIKPDYIGFIFTSSKREIDKAKAKVLSKALLKNIKKVGVFRNNKIEKILDLQKEISLDVIQLHGDENNEYIKILKKKLNSNVEIWKSLVIDKETDLQNYKSDYIDYFVLDGVKPGSGKTFYWSNINNKNSSVKFFLAGGINEDNVIEGINNTNPYGIDVSSGVEFINENGIRTKSLEKMKNLIRKVRNN